jgi:hypothetical protein
MNRAKGLLVAASAVATLAAAAAVPCSCSSTGEGGTSGKRIALTVKVAGSPEATAPFTNAQGWTIMLSKALAATGALYYYDGATILSMSAPPRRSPAPRLWHAVHDVVERTAFAHPGHYVPGEARGEYLAPSSVDLRTETVLGRGDGVSGIVRSATFSFGSPAAGPFAAQLGTHVVVLEGTATKAAETRVFRAEIDAADVRDARSQPAVEGCPFAETDMQKDGVVTLTVKIAQWFDQVELDAVPKSEDGAPVAIPKTATSPAASATRTSARRNRP